MGQSSAPRTGTSSGYTEADRLSRVLDYNILDTGRDSTFDRFVYTAAQMFRVPIALMSIMDTDRQWIKAGVGMEISEVARTDSFCEYVGISDGVVVVEDATLDVRFHDNPLVTGPPFVRFYAGVALVTPDRLRVGSLCVIDNVPKTLLAKQLWQLSQLAESIVLILEKRRTPVHP